VEGEEGEREEEEQYIVGGSVSTSGPIITPIHHTSSSVERDAKRDVILFTREASKLDALNIRVVIGKTSSIIRGIVVE
jgi:hypothetical protein